jgi:adhesin HecA-like repeat protein
MVEVTLADGRKALKPVVYFAQATRMNIDSFGALIVAGGDLKLTAANDITNSGTLSGAKTTLASTSGSITNSYGKLAATNGDLSVTADQNITNTGGLITGKDVKHQKNCVFFQTVLQHLELAHDLHLGLQKGHIWAPE